MKRYKFRALYILAHLGLNVFMRNTATQNAGFALMIIALVCLVSGLDAGNDGLTGCAVLLGIIALTMIGDAAQRMMQQ